MSIEASITNNLTNLTSGNGCIPSYTYDYESFWYDTFTTLPLTLPKPALIYNSFYGLYCFTYGPTNTPGYKLWPTRYTEIDGQKVLDDTQPKYFYTTQQLTNYSFITEIIDSQHFALYQPFFPTTPFYLYYIDKITTEDQDLPRILEKIRVNALTQIDGQWVAETASKHTLKVTGQNNYPLVAFYYAEIDDKLPDDQKALPEIEELSIPFEDRWDQWSVRPHSFHQIRPLRAFTYTDTPTINWMFPFPYPDQTYDDLIFEPYVQYGYTTPKALQQGIFYYESLTYKYYVNNKELVPMAKSLVDMPLITNGFGRSAKRMYFQVDAARYRVAVTTWT